MYIGVPAVVDVSASTLEVAFPAAVEDICTSESVALHAALPHVATTLTVRASIATPPEVSETVTETAPTPVGFNVAPASSTVPESVKLNSFCPTEIVPTPSVPGTTAVQTAGPLIVQNAVSLSLTPAALAKIVTPAELRGT